MEYKIDDLSKLASVSKRTLRYYDEIGLLKPLKINSSGYRVYGSEEVKKLQQILFYKELGMDLNHIKSILGNKYIDYVSILNDHKEKLLEKRNLIDQLINNINNTIKTEKGEIFMNDKERFEGFKKEQIDNNEKKYGKEIREKYGDDKVNESNQRYMKMTNEEYRELEDLGNKVLEALKEAKEAGLESDKAKELVLLHKKWLCFHWKEYNEEAHINLGNMYVDDERFRAYYDDKIGNGSALFLRDALEYYLK